MCPTNYSLPKFHAEQANQLAKLCNTGKVDEILHVLLNTPPDTYFLDVVKNCLEEAIIGTQHPENYLLLLERLQEQHFLLPEKTYSELAYRVLEVTLKAERSNFSTIFINVLSSFQDQNLTLMLIKTLRNYDFFIQNLASLSPQHQIQFIFPLLKLAFQENLLACVIKIKQALPELYIKLLQEEALQQQPLAKLIASINTFSPPDYRLFCETQLTQLSLGAGHISDTQAQLVLAATINDKSMTPPPTLLTSCFEMKPYLKSLKTATPPICERFIVAGTHWLTGQIYIDKDNNASLLIIDPLGVSTEYDSCWSEDIIQDFAAAFPPPNKIYISADERLNAKKGCSIFALDDVRHLYTVNNYLDPELYPEGLFQYLEAHGEGAIKYDKTEVKIAHLPLPLLRTMQSTDLLYIMTESSVTDPERKLNKKGMTVRQFSEDKPGFFERKTPKGRKLQNTRLEDKHKKMFNRTVNYVLTHDFETVKQGMNRCSLEGFEERMKAQHQEQPEPKSP